MKTILLLSFFLLAGITYSQSKKEQIELLTYRVDSLNKVLSLERVDNSKKISTLESSKTYLEERYNELENDYNSLVNKVSTLSSDLQTSNAERASKQQTINDLQTQLQSKKDSLDLIKAELEKLKPAPKPVVVNNTTNQVTQTVSFKSVKIGTQTWMAENLNVSTFRNGDQIPEAKTKEEWEKAGKEGRPAWCYYENDPKNGTKYGKLYNWYAVNDSRGLAPSGWHITTDAEWTILKNQLGDDAGKKMKSTSGWEITEELQENGNGTNSSGFSGLPGGLRYINGNFLLFGRVGFWWSSTEHDTSGAYKRWLTHEDGSLSGDNCYKGEGFSVRCLKD
jgi:uncharacterized protein (TIGR02145 family)